jgi:hypothetical protein
MIEIKTLRKIAADVRTLLEVYTPVNVIPNAKTRGNLKKQMLGYNSSNKIIGKSKQVSQFNIVTNWSQTLSVSYAPPGAEYGKYWNDPTVASNIRNGKTSNIPGKINFASKSLNEAIQKNVKLLARDLARGVADDIRKGIVKR